MVGRGRLGLWMTGHFFRFVSVPQCSGLFLITGLRENGNGTTHPAQYLSLFLLVCPRSVPPSLFVKYPLLLLGPDGYTSETNHIISFLFLPVPVPIPIPIALRPPPQGLFILYYRVSPMAASSSAPPWPRMHTDQKNPFQNAPGPFVYALPNLTGTCPFSFSDTVLSCPFADSTGQHNHDCYHHPAVTFCCHQHTPTTESEAPVVVPAPPPTPLDESHFDLGDIISSSLPEGGAEIYYTTKQHHHQQERTSEPPTPTHSHTLSSPMGSEFPEAKDENENGEGEGDGEEDVVKGKGRRRCRKRRKRNTRGRLSSEHAGGCVMGPRVMGLSGMHFDRWTRYVCPAPAPPPPQSAPMNPAWFVPGYNDGFAAPRNSSPAYPMMVQAVQAPGFISVPYW